MFAFPNFSGAVFMKKREPEFDQWTDQNHVPFRPALFTESQRNSSAEFTRRGLNLLWHNVLKFFGHVPVLGSVKR
jgi:hypothetical protein